MGIALSGWPQAPEEITQISVGVVGEGHHAARARLALAAAGMLAEPDTAAGRPPGASASGVMLVAADEPATLWSGIAEALALAPGHKLAVLAAIDEPQTLVAAVTGGVDGWILPDASGEELVACLAGLARGEVGFGHVVTVMLVAALRSLARGPQLAQVPGGPHQGLGDPIGHPHGLTNRERQILRAREAGRSIAEIAAALSLSEVTVRWHAGRGSKKLNAPRPLPTGGPPPASPPGPRALTLVPAEPEPSRSQPGRARLGRAELRVALLVAEGLNNREVAERLHISRHTVESHLKQIFTKLGVRSRVALTRLMLTTAPDAD